MSTELAGRRVSWQCPRDEVLVDHGRNQQVMHPFMWITISRPPAEALDRIMRILVSRAHAALDQVAAGLGQDTAPPAAPNTSTARSSASDQ